MTLMLASVTSPSEARTALAQGADVIDLKDPRAGALGALPAATVAAVVSSLAGGCLTSATIGDLPPTPGEVRDAALAMAASGVDFVKIGLFERRHPVAFVRALRAPGVLRGRLVLVMFADRRPDMAVLPVLAGCGFRGVMLDTAEKGARGLRDCLPGESLAAFVREARGHGLVAGLAGSLRVEDIAPLLALQPDLLGFRTALCGSGGRGGALDPRAVREVRSHIPRFTHPGLTRRTPLACTA